MDLFEREFFDAQDPWDDCIPRHPSHPLVIPLEDRCLEPLKAFSGDVCGFKHLLNRYDWMLRGIFPYSSTIQMNYSFT